MSIERRTANEGVEFRENGDSVTAIGYAAVFNSRSSNLGGFREEVSPGAFRKTLQEADVRALFNHEPDHLLGRTANGTLRLEEDNKGLRYEIDINTDTQIGRDVAAMLRRADLSQSSFGFRTISDSWSESEDGYPLRHLNEVALRDVGPVSFPAYQAAEASLRSLAEAHDLPIDQVVEAAEANNLQSLLNDDEAVETDSEPDQIHSVGLPPSSFIR